MASAGSIFVDLLLKDANYVQGLNRARGSTRQFSGSVQGDMSKTGRAFNSVLSPVNNIGTAIAGLSGVLAGALSTQKIVAYADAYAALESRLNLVTGSAEETARVQQRLFEISQDNAQPLNETISAYTRLSNSLGENQKAQYDLTRITELLSKTLVISGTNAAGAATFFQQFGQAASSDFKAIGQEIQTFADQNPAFFKILNDEAINYGKTLKQLAADGGLSFQFVADALLKSGAEIDNNSQQIALTVGRAFQQLDNAFLRFIGQSDVVNEGTSSLALGISFLAQNLDTASKAVVLIASVMAARMVPALASSAVSFITVTRESLAVQLSLARLNGTMGQNIALSNSTRIAAINAATGVTTLTSATTASSIAMLGLSRSAGLALSIVGGPFGAAFLAAGAAVYYLSTQTSELEKVQKESQGTMSALDGLYSKLTTASTARASEIRKEMVALYDLQVAELETNKARLATIQTNRAGYFGKAADYVTSQERALSERIEAQRKALEDLQDSVLARATMAAAPSIITPPKIDKEAQKEAAKQAKDLASIYDRNRSIITGLDNSTIKYSDTLGELNQLLSGGLITQDEYSEALIRAQDEYDNLSAKTSVWAIDTEAAAKRAAENIQDSLADFLFDPFEKGLAGMLDSFVKTLQRMAAEAASKQILIGLFGEGGFSSGGGIIGSIFNSGPSLSQGSMDLAKGGSLFSFDVGTNYVPRDMVANIHKGEMIIPAYDAEKMRNGGMGGNNVTVNVINNSQSNVRTEERDNGNGMELMVMIDEAVARNMGTPGTRTNQALGAFNNRGLIRR